MKRTTTLSTLMLIAALPLGALAATPSQPAPGDTPSNAAPANPSASQPASPDASSSNQQAPHLFKELDKNHDNYVSMTEAKRSAEVKSRFQSLDTNHDGKISVPEFLKGKIS